MSSTIAIMIVAAIYIVALAPLVFLARNPKKLAPLAGVYVAIILAIATVQSGLFAAPALPSLEDVPLSDARLSDAQCTQLLTLLENEGVIVDRRSPPRLTVSQSSWEQLPPEIHDATMACVQRTWPRNAAPAQVEIRP
jgi:hypothetical protein